MIIVQLLSLSVNVLCLIQKLPQILRIYQTKNVDSISVSSVLLEETAYTLLLTYNLWRNYPFSAFFEYFILFFQDLLLLWALAQYSTQGKDKTTDRSRPLYGILIFSLYLIACLMGLVPEAWLNVCTMFVIPIGASSKLIQLRTIIANKSAGQVTRTGWIIAAYGSAARIVTNLYLTQDMKIMANLSIGLILNVAVAIVCTIYPQKAVSASAENTKEKTT